MKTQTAIKLVTLLLITSLLACGKKEIAPIMPPPPPPPVVLPDTLSAGWTKQKVGNVTVSDINFQSNTIGYAISATWVFATQNGGISWDSVHPSLSSNSANLATTPAGSLFIVGSKDAIYQSVNKGVVFSTVALGNSYELQDVFFTGNDTGYASEKTGVLVRTVDAGASWQAINTTGILHTESGYASVFFLNGANGWLTVGSTVYKTDGSSANWTKGNIPGSTSTQAITMSIYAVSAAIVYLGGNDGKLFKSTNGGLNFSLIKTFPSPGGFLDVHFINSQLGYACYGNSIYKTTDAGNNWQPVVALGNDRLVEIYFTDATHGWACGLNGVMLRFNG